MIFKTHKKLFAAIAAIVIVTTVLASTLAFAAAPLPADTAANRTVSVSGTAQVTLKPDIAYVVLGVQTPNVADISTGRDANSTLMIKVIAALKAQGVDTDKDVQTVNYSINTHNDANGKLTGYDIVNSIRVKVRKLDNLSTILDASTTAGANSAYDLNFAVEDTEAAYNQAIVKAINNAKLRADTLAKSAGATLGAVVSVSENGGGYYPQVNYGRDMMNSAGSVPVSSGTLQIPATVNVTYQLN